MKLDANQGDACNLGKNDCGLKEMEMYKTILVAVDIAQVEKAERILLKANQ